MAITYQKDIMTNDPQPTEGAAAAAEREYREIYPDDGPGGPRTARLPDPDDLPRTGVSGAHQAEAETDEPMREAAFRSYYPEGI